MPELPEVQTTVSGLNRTVVGLKILDVWTNYNSPFHANKDNIKNPKFFREFKKKTIGQKILKAERRAKNILIHLSSNQTILIHMKMTGHLLYGQYKHDKKNDKWAPSVNGPLGDSFNSFIRLVFSLSNGKHLALSDMRRFAKATIIDTDKLEDSLHLEKLGPEPLDPNFELSAFSLQLKKRPKGKVKQVLMDKSTISGIGNIYSDEILWRASVHPLSRVEKIPEKNLKRMFKATKETLLKGIDFGGDSMSDYRNIFGKKGKFQDHHQVYRRTGKKCAKRGCRGVIERTIVGARSAHFCPIHQLLYV